MERIPAILETAFSERMVGMGLVVEVRRRWLKWLRFYLDFCLKYEFPPREATSLEPWLEKLASKGQTEFQRDEARRSLGLFYEIVPDFGGPGRKVRREEGGVRREGDVVKRSEEQLKWDACLQRLEEVMALRQLARTTRKTYRMVVERFRAFAREVAFEEVGDDEAVAFLTHMAVVRNVSASTQNQAFNALLFLFRHVLERPYELGKRVKRAKTRKYVPQILSRLEVENVIGVMPYPYSLVASLLVGCGLRLSEGLGLRVQDFDFDAMRLTVRRGKGGKDRVVPLPEAIRAELEAHLERVVRLYGMDEAEGDWLGAFMPESGSQAGWARRSKGVGWQFFFPAKSLTVVAEEGGRRRYHLHPENFGKCLRTAVRSLRITKRVTAHTFRHTFASHLLLANVDVRTVQGMLGHADVRTTMIYTQTVPSRTLTEQKSPLDLEGVGWGASLQISQG